MSNGSSPDKTAPEENRGIHQGIAWIVQGWHLIQEQPPLWFGMAAIYLVLGFLLKQIPIGGELLMILISPMLLASVVWGRAHASHAEPLGQSSPVQALLQDWIVLPARELVCIFNHVEKTVPPVLLSILTLGLMLVIVMIPRESLVGGSMMSGLAASNFSDLQFIMLLKMLVVAALYVILAMCLFYSVPLTVLKNRPPFDAIAESFKACREHAVPRLVLTVPFFVVYLVILAAFAKNHWLGVLFVISAGVVALPVFVASVYCSYLALYPPDHSPSPR